MITFVLVCYVLNQAYPDKPDMFIIQCYTTKKFTKQKISVLSGNILCKK